MTGAETLLIASTVLSASTSVMGGIASAKASAIEQQQARDAAEDRRIQGLQEANAIRADADRAMRRNIALRAASGLSLNSGSFVAIQTDVQRHAESDVKNTQYQTAAEASRYELQGKQSKIAGRSALQTGFLGAGTTLLKGGQSYLKSN